MQKIFIALILLCHFAFAGYGVGTSAYISLTSMPPDAPELSAPAHGTTGIADSTVLSWHSQIHTSGFNLQLSTTPDFETALVDKADIGDTLYAASDLARETLHYWRVSAVNAAGISDYSTVWFFTTLKAVAIAPILYQPEDGSMSINPNVELRWNNVPGALSYHLQVSEQNDFSTLTIDESNLTNVWYQVDLEMEKNWYWRVSATNEGGEGEFSNNWTFSTWSTGIENGEALPKTFALLPVYPNPFNPTAYITYHLPKTSDLSLIIYNSVGQSIRTLVSGQQQAGRYTIQWDGHDNYGHSVTSGMYLCRFTCGDHVFIQKMLLLR